MSADRLLYLYGVTPADQDLPPDTAASLRTISHAGVTAVVEFVAASEFAPGLIEQNQQSLEWVAPLARKHQAVLEQILCCGTVAPSRLCTLFSTEAALRVALEVGAELLLATLERIRGRQEWGVKVFCEEARLRAACADRDPELQRLHAEWAAATAGNAFILGKRRQARLEDLVSAALDDLVDEVLDTLETVAVDLRQRPLPSDPTPAAEPPMVLNTAALVDQAAATPFLAAVAGLSERLHADGLLFQISGPWAAYSFVDEDAVAAQAHPAEDG